MSKRDTDREALIETATWALIDYDTDVADRGVTDEHYRKRRADVERVFPILFPARNGVEAMTDEALWDFAEDLLDLWDISDENPPSLVEQFRDRFLLRFGVGRPAPVTDTQLVDLWWATVGEVWAVPDEVAVGFGRAAIRAALNGGENNV